MKLLNLKSIKYGILPIIVLGVFITPSTFGVGVGSPVCSCVCIDWRDRNVYQDKKCKDSFWDIKEYTTDPKDDKLCTPKVSDCERGYDLDLASMECKYGGHGTLKHCRHVTIPTPSSSSAQEPETPSFWEPFEVIESEAAVDPVQ